MPKRPFDHPRSRLSDKVRLLERWLECVPSECHPEVRSLHIVNEVWRPGIPGQWHKQEDIWRTVARKLKTYGYTEEKLHVSLYSISLEVDTSGQSYGELASVIVDAFGKVGSRVAIR